MKICGTCKQKYSDSLEYCLADGTVLSSVNDQPTLRIETRATQTNPAARRGMAIGVVIAAIGGALAIIGLIAIVALYRYMGTTSAEKSDNRPSSSARTSSTGNDDRSPSKDDVAKNLEQANSDVGMSMVRNDVTALDRLLADDYHYISDAGLSLNKADVMNLFRTGNVHYDYLTTSDPTVEVENDLSKGVVTGRAQSKGRLNGQPFTDHYIYKNTYEKRNGNWQLVEAISRHH